MKRLIAVNVIGLTVFIAACTAKTNLMKGKSPTIATNEVLTVKGLWLKDKKIKYDLGLQLTNMKAEPFVLLLSNMYCSKGLVTGVVISSSLQKKEETRWTFEPNETKQFYIICKLPRYVRTDTYKFGISQVYQYNNTEGKMGREPLLKEKVELLVNK